MGSSTSRGIEDGDHQENYTLATAQAWAPYTPSNSVFTPLYCQLLTETAYTEITSNPYEELYDTMVVSLSAEPMHKYHHRVLLAIELHDLFAIAKDFLDRLKLPVNVVCRKSDDFVTGIELLAIGSPSKINWLHFLVSNSDVMREFFLHGELRFARSDLTAIACAKTHQALATPPKVPPRAPRNIPRLAPRTQYEVPPPASAYAFRQENQACAAPSTSRMQPWEVPHVMGDSSDEDIGATLIAAPITVSPVSEE